MVGILTNIFTISIFHPLKKLVGFGVAGWWKTQKFPG